MNQLHAVSRTQQGRQRELSVKTLRSPLSAEFWKHCVSSGGVCTYKCFNFLPRIVSYKTNIYFHQHESFFYFLYYVFLLYLNFCVVVLIKFNIIQFIFTLLIYDYKLYLYLQILPIK